MSAFLGVPAQRHAVDLVQWRDGATARGDGAENRDYHAWGEAVGAPAAGVVVAARDGVEVANETEPPGNHVILRLRDGRHVLLAHLARGTVAVGAGDRVRAGAFLGRVGNSGNSSEPHLHLHVADGPDLVDATGLPTAFSDLVVDGRRTARAELGQGSFVAAR